MNNLVLVVWVYSIIFFNCVGLFWYCSAAQVNIRHHKRELCLSFSIRAIDKWNNLTDDIVNSSTVLSFKTMNDRYMGDQKYHTGYIYCEFGCKTLGKEAFSNTEFIK